MAITSQDNVNTFVADGTTTVFTSTFISYSVTHIQVYVDSILQSSGFTIGTIPITGGVAVVTFAVAPAANARVTIRREVPVTQLTEFTTGGAFPAKTLERTLDLQTMSIQQVVETSNRTVKLPVGSPANAEFPNINDPANQGRAIRINSTGTGFDTFDVSSTPFSSVITTKGDLAVYSTTVDRLPVGTTGQVILADSSVARGMKWVGLHDVPGVEAMVGAATNQTNLIHNGHFLVWQRGVTFTAPPTASLTADRWIFSNGTSGVVDITRSTDVPAVTAPNPQPRYSLLVTSTTADTTIGASEFLGVYQHVPGNIWQPYWQRPFVLSFWVKSSLAGLYHVNLFNTSVTNRGITLPYTINAANTWEYKTVTVPASPSSGTWDLSSVSGGGILCYFTLASGTDFSNSSTNAWNTISTAVLQATGSLNVNWISATGRTFQLYGVQADLGTTNIVPRTVNFMSELDVCLNYYQKSFAYDTAPGQNAGGSNVHLQQQVNGASSPSRMIVYYHKPFLVTPSLTLYNPHNFNALVRNLETASDTSSNSTTVYPNMFYVSYTTTAGSSAFQLNALHWAASLGI